MNNPNNPFTHPRVLESLQERLIDTSQKAKSAELKEELLEENKRLTEQWEQLQRVHPGIVAMAFESQLREEAEQYTYPFRPVRKWIEKNILQKEVLIPTLAGILLTLFTSIHEDDTPLWLHLYGLIGSIVGGSLLLRPFTKSARIRRKMEEPEVILASTRTSFNNLLKKIEEDAQRLPPPDGGTLI